jgi:hypothetical protein
LRYREDLPTLRFKEHQSFLCREPPKIFIENLRRIDEHNGSLRHSHGLKSISRFQSETRETNMDGDEVCRYVEEFYS